MGQKKMFPPLIYSQWVGWWMGGVCDGVCVCGGGGWQRYILLKKQMPAMKTEPWVKSKDGFPRSRWYLLYDRSFVYFSLTEFRLNKHSLYIGRIQFQF